MKRSKEEIIELINWFEQEWGESFNDYFSHDRISNVVWASWLLGKGHIEHANNLLNQMKDNTSVYIGQEELYEIYPEYIYEPNETWMKENYEKNTEIMAEFLSSSDIYQDKFDKFITPKLENKEED
jgi:spore coat polysaccharide biosynthesis predicted glycosyltransferase SpsG